MRAVFGILGLVIVVAVIGVLAKKQLASVAVPSVAPPGASAAPAGAVTPRQQMDQLKQGLESTLQQPREIPDDKK